MRNHRLTTALVRLALLTTAGFLIAGCGEGTTQISVEDQPSAPAAAGTPETELTIERAMDPAGDPSAGLPDFSPGVWTLTCSPVGGDHPDPEAACAALADTGVKPFEPVPDDQPCTLIYGGAETAIVTGHVGAEQVNAEFNRANGCEIDRWEQLSPLLSP